jgi:hypothetical protein
MRQRRERWKERVREKKNTRVFILSGITGGMICPFSLMEFFVLS